MYQPNVMQDVGKGKGKSREIDFEAAFEQATASLNASQPESARIVEVPDGVEELADTLQSSRLTDEDVDQSTASLGTDFATYVGFMIIS